MFARILLALLIGSTLSIHARPWTSSDGKTIEAEFIELDGETVVLKVKEKEFRLPISRLSAADQDFAREAGKAAADEAAPAAPAGSYMFGDETIKPGELKTITLTLSAENSKLAEKGRSSWRIRSYLGSRAYPDGAMITGTASTETATLIGLPDEFDPTKSTPIFVQWTTGDLKNNLKGGKAYWKSCKANGIVLLSVDSLPTPEAGWNTPNFLAHINTALEQLETSFPGARSWPIAVGGFSGGSKISQWMAPLMAEEGYPVKGIYIGGCNQTFFSCTLEDYKVKKGTLRDLKAYISSGKEDKLVSETHRDKVENGVKDSGIKDYRAEVYEGGHSIDHPQFVEAIQWITGDPEDE